MNIYLPLVANGPPRLLGTRTLELYVRKNGTMVGIGVPTYCNCVLIFVIQKVKKRVEFCQS